MSMSDVDRRVLHIANGTQKAFPFAFTVFEASQINVYRVVGEDPETLVAPSEYRTVISTTGGTITFTKAPKEGTRIAIVSAIPYDQPMALTNYGGFNPETLNHNADLQAAQIQQLKGQLDRCIRLKPTDTMTAEELKDWLDEISAIIERMRAVVICQDETMIIDEAVAEGAEITLPIFYKPGSRQLHLCWNSLALSNGFNYEEVPSAEGTSNRIKILFPLSVGDELIVRTIPVSTF